MDLRNGQKCGDCLDNRQNIVSNRQIFLFQFLLRTKTLSSASNFVQLECASLNN